MIKRLFVILLIALLNTTASAVVHTKYIPVDNTSLVGAGDLKKKSLVFTCKECGETKSISNTFYSERMQMYYAYESVHGVQVLQPKATPKVCSKCSSVGERKAAIIFFSVVILFIASLFYLFRE